MADRKRPRTHGTGAASVSGAPERGKLFPPAVKEKQPAPAVTEFSKRTLIEHQKQLREQKLLLSKLRKENATLREELQAESSQTQAGTGLASSQLVMVSKLSEEAELYVRMIEQERRRAAELDKRCKDFDKRILESKSASDSLDRFIKDAKHISKTLENRLHAAKTKFGEFITQNKALRQNIDELRFERSHFKNSYEKVEKELAWVNSEVERVVTESKTLFDERLQVIHRIKEMQVGSDEEQKNYMAQCRELNAVLQAFEQSEKATHAGRLLYELQDHIGAMTNDQEEELQRKIVRGKWQLAKEKALGDVLRDQAVTFEDALTRIQQATGYAHMDDFVSHFIQIEEHNFHRFKYLNSLNQDIEKASDEVVKLRMEALALGEQEVSSDKNWESLQREAEERVQKLESAAEDTENKTAQLESSLTSVIDVMRALTDKIGCTLDRADMMPHEVSDEVSETNLLKWLAAVEARAAELLALQAAQQALISTDDFERPHVALGPKRMGKTYICTLEASATLGAGTRAMIRPPSIKDDDIGHEEEAELDEPLGEESLRSRVVTTSDTLVSHNLSWMEARTRSAGQKDKKALPQAEPRAAQGFSGVTKRINILSQQPGTEPAPPNPRGRPARPARR